MAIRKFPRRRPAAILDLLQTEIAPFDPPTSNPTLEPNMLWIGWPVAEIWPFEIFKNARSVGRWSVGRRSSILYIVLMYSSSLRPCCDLDFDPSTLKTSSFHQDTRPDTLTDGHTDTDGGGGIIKPTSARSDVSVETLDDGVDERSWESLLQR